VNDKPYLAHSHDQLPEEEWHELRRHLEDVARRAAEHAEPFGAAKWALLAGLWHDLGKYHPRFQSYIRGRASSGGDHAAPGALLAREKAADERFLPLAFAIAGHHAGLANLASGERPTPLKIRLRDAALLLDEVKGHVPAELLAAELPEIPERLRQQTRKPGEIEALRRALEFWVRFVFSALVDADYLDTEAFYRRGERERETAGRETVPVLRARLDAHVDRLAAGSPATEVNRLRARVLEACRERAELEPGLFSLSVPTGGGKTLAAMAFALRHAEEHGLRRVIAVIPYTSIIEQNAAVYRDALGETNVIEHHSNLDPETETPRNKLASENWDAPIIVTTAVQFFESLFSNRPSRCRKLHNVAGSVVLLDEAQTLPIAFQMSILEALRELTENFGCSVVLSTATQPAFERREEVFEHGLEGVREIAPDPAELAQRLRRYRVEWPVRASGSKPEPVVWEELAEAIQGERQVLAIVHRRDDARELAQHLPEEGRFHLSALMCASHRLEVLGRVKAALDRGEPCRLVSTQLVEAGVDVDFPVVYRALGGLDSLVQAAGRCNREGWLEAGRLVVFRAPTKPPPGTPSHGLESTEVLLAKNSDGIDLADPGVMAEFFRLLFAKEEPDVHGVESCRAELKFASVAEKFRLIDNYSVPVVVPHGLSAERLSRFREEGPSRERLRALQPYVVNVAPWQLERLVAAGALELVHDMVYALGPGWQHLYDRAFGLRLDRDPVADPSAFVI